jgi:hypothetical protein
MDTGRFGLTASGVGSNNGERDKESGEGDLGDSDTGARSTGRLSTVVSTSMPRSSHLKSLCFLPSMPLSSFAVLPTNFLDIILSSLETSLTSGFKFIALINSGSCDR